MKALFRGLCIVLLLSTLVFAAAGAQPVQQAPAGKLFKTGCNPPTASGDWVVSDAETCVSQTIAITGNVIIKNGGSLTLQATTLKTSPASDCNTGITVEQGGKLFVQQGSVLSSAGKRFLIQANDGSTLEVTNSELTNCGCGSGKNCLTDYAANTVFSNNNAHDNKGMIVFAGGNAVVSQNTFSKNDEGVGFGRMKGGNSFTSNTASNSVYGVEFGGGSGNNVIQGNTLTNNQYGLYVCCGGANNKVTGNHVNNNAKKGILAIASSSEFSNNEVKNNGGNGIEVKGSSNTLKLNTASFNQGHGILVLLADSALIQGNDAEKNAGDGIRLSFPQANNVVESNVVKNNAYGAGIRVETVFQENNYGQTQNYAYAPTSSSADIVLDPVLMTASGSAGGVIQPTLVAYPVSSASQTQTTFSKNTVQNNLDGLLVYTDWVNKNVVITNDNTISGNTRFGIILIDAVINADFDATKIDSNGEGKIMRLWSGRLDVYGQISKQYLKDWYAWFDGILSGYEEPHPYSDYFDQSLYHTEKVKTNVYWVFADGTSTWFTPRVLLWEYYVKNDNSMRNNNPHIIAAFNDGQGASPDKNPYITAPFIIHAYAEGGASKQGGVKVVDGSVTEKRIEVTKPTPTTLNKPLTENTLVKVKNPIKPVSINRIKTSV